MRLRKDQMAFLIIIIIIYAAASTWNLYAQSRAKNAKEPINITDEINPSTSSTETEKENKN